MRFIGTQIVRKWVQIAHVGMIFIELKSIKKAPVGLIGSSLFECSKIA